MKTTDAIEIMRRRFGNSAKFKRLVAKARKEADTMQTEFDRKVAQIVRECDREFRNAIGTFERRKACAIVANVLRARMPWVYP